MIETIKKIIKDYIDTTQPTDLIFGEVTKVNPLEITLSNTMLPIPEQCIYITESVLEKSIDDVKHTHQYFDQDTGEGATGSATRTTEEALTNIQGYNKINNELVPLGKTKENKIILNKGLEIKDKVLLLKVNHGQKFVVLSRLIEGKNANTTRKQ